MLAFCELLPVNRAQKANKYMCGVVPAAAGLITWPEENNYNMSRSKLSSERRIGLASGVSYSCELLRI